MAKVIKDFRDKQNANKLYSTKGENKEYTGPREQELIELGYLEAPKKDKLDDLTVPELKEQAKEKGIEGYSDMKKAQLIEELEK